MKEEKFDDVLLAEVHKLSDKVMKKMLTVGVGGFGNPDGSEVSILEDWMVFSNEGYTPITCLEKIEEFSTPLAEALDLLLVGITRTLMHIADENEE